ncbi:MarR family transcriptional regulator, partial [Streptomyces sp. NPDC006261]
RRILMECTDCGRPGPPQALPDGLCHTCRTTHRPDSRETPIDPADIKARMTNLRGLLKTV